MAQSMTAIFKDGQEYMKTWPMQKQLYALFPECRVISATKLSMRVMPPLGVICAAMFINQHGTEFIPQAVAIAAFFLSLPLQGLMWLGHRSNQVLPPALKSWYFEIQESMMQQGVEVNVPSKPLRYKELARLLKLAFSELDKVFTNRWF